MDKHLDIIKIVLVYAVFGCLWIYLSDTALEWLFSDPRRITQFAIAKGLLFIALTSLLLSILIARLSAKLRQSSQALSESEGRLQVLVKNSSDSLIIINPDRSQRYVSPAAEKITGFAITELEGKTLEALIHPDDMGAISAAWDEAVQHPDKTVTVQYRHVHKTRGWVYSEAVAQSFLDDPAIRGLVASVRDISERKQAEQERKALQAQLIQAQKMEAIGTLAGGIAHDFNNILGAILGYAEMAKDNAPPDSPLVADIDKILEAAERAASLVKQILAFSRQVKIERIPLEPGPLIKEAIKLLRPALPATIDIRQQVAVSTLPILADPSQIHQIVMNLCTNAFHAMEQKGGALTLSLEDCELAWTDVQLYPHVHPGPFVRLSISDTGSGISPDIKDKIFDPYFTTKEVGKGTGMGLAIAHGIVTHSGGFITCDSAMGQGTRFDIYFPAIAREVLPSVAPEPADLTGKGHILFIDDELLLAEMGKAMLERLGYEVTVCTDSFEAIEIFARDPHAFHAVITDQTMPGMTGVELARKMLHLRADLPIILCTGYSSLINEQQAAEWGMKGFVMKPFKKQDLAAQLRKIFGPD